MKRKDLSRIYLPAVLLLASVSLLYATGLPPFSTAGIRTNPVLSGRGAPGFTYAVQPWYKYRKDGKPGREVILYFGQDRPAGRFTVTMDWKGKKETVAVVPGGQLDSLALLLPYRAGLEATEVALTMENGNRKVKRTLVIPAKRQWTVYIYPHSHVDIGYTNLQQVVEKLHVRNIDVGIDLARKTKHYPEGARFVWNPEATWVVDSYLKNASPQQKASFIEAVQKGWIQVDAAHSNINTSTCSDEELLRMFRNSHAISALTGVPLTTMVQMDNPGGGWGLVQAAVQNGVRGFLSFPNYFDLRRRWENKPFYWVAPDGKNRLFYLQATSYGYGYRAKGRKYGLAKIQALTDEYDRLSTEDPLADFIDPFIFNETEQLEKENSPYDIYAMTWSMADNCLIDADLPEAVRLWNEKYAYPKLVIAGSREIVAAYETKYGSVIPEYRGDMTEFWTQGLGSDALRVGMGRRGKEQLVQAETLWPMLDKTALVPVKRFNEAWENVLLSAEHTWGYQNPKAPLAREVEANKAAYFAQAERQGRELIDLALPPAGPAAGFSVVNTLSWPRAGLVTLSAEQSRAGDRVVNGHGREVLSQRLSTGELVFQTDSIPALASLFYRVGPGKAGTASTMVDGPAGLRNERVAITIDEHTGNISSLIDLRTGRQLVNASTGFELNSYNYLTGVRNGRPEVTLSRVYKATDVAIRVKENGPLLAALLISSKAEGCNWLTREVRVTRNQPQIELVNTVDKIATREKEGIHFGFAFNVPGGIIRMDIPLGVMIPEREQIAYSNKNWFAVQRWLDISNQDHGVTWATIEAPIVEVGDITGTILDGARQAAAWIKRVPETQTVFSWPVNNHWDTNFPLEQGGVIRFRYGILPHQGGYDPVVANRFGVEQHRPLLAVASDRNLVGNALVALDNPRVMLSTLKKSEDNRAVIIRLRSVSDRQEVVALRWPAGAPGAVFACRPDEQAGQKSTGTITLPPYGTASLRVVW